MPTVKTQRLPFLDGVRGVAILSVFLFHSLGASYGFDQLEWSGLFRDFNNSPSFLSLYPLTYGSEGVAIFFVVSGFCIHLSYQNSFDKSWKAFLAKRFFRIYPPYIIAVVVILLFLRVASHPSDSEALQFFAHLFSIHNFNDKTLYGISPSFWSIAVELQLYLLYLFLFLLSTRLGWRYTLLTCAIIEIGIRFVISYQLLHSEPSSRILASSPFAFWLSWSLGAYLCECYLRSRPSRLFAIRFDLLFLFAIFVPLFKPTSSFSFLVFSLLTALALQRLLTDKWIIPTNRFFNFFWSHLSFLGVISFSFYLYHQSLLRFCTKIISIIFPVFYDNPLIKFILCLLFYPFILLTSFVLYHLIEKPSMRLGRAVLSKKEAL